MDSFEFARASRRAQLVEQPSPTDGLELTGITDEDQSPPLRIGEGGQLIERSGAQHASLIDHECRPDR